MSSLSYRRKGAKRVSGALRLLGREDAGLAIDFLDMSIAIRDNGTLANNFVGDVSDKLTYTSPAAKMVRNAQGLYVSASTLRTEYDVNSIPLGLLVESARTNLGLRSEEIGTSPWNVGAAASVTSNNAVSPDGQTTAELITATGTGTNGYVNQGATLSTTTAYTASFFAKAGTATFFNMTVYDGTDGNRYWFNLGTGAVASTALVNSGLTSPSAAIVSVGNGWYRCIVTFTSKSGTSFINFYAFTDADASLTLTSGKTGYLWGYQLEAGTVATSYIPTAGSSATRAEDNLSIATSAFPFSATVGTIWSSARTPSGIASQVVWQLDDGTANERILHWRNSSRNPVRSVVDGGSDQVSDTTGTVNDWTIFRHAMAWQANSFAWSQEGAAAVADTSGTLPTVTTLRFGRDHSASHFNGHLRKLLYVPRRVADGDLPSFGAAA